MSYIGAEPSQQITTPAIDYFSGNGVTTTFTLTRAVTSVFSVEVVVNGVQQNPRTAYTINQAGNIVFDGAPSAGTNNIYVMYNSQVGQFVTPSPGTVVPSSMSNGGPSWDFNGNTTLGGNATIGGNLTFLGSVTPTSGTLTVNGTGGMVIPSGTTAQRSGTVAGSIRYNSTIGAPEQYISGAWQSLLGTTPAYPASSAAAILTANPSAPSGYYWLRLTGMTQPFQAYCKMDFGGGWMMLDRLIPEIGGTTPVITGNAVSSGGGDMIGNDNNNPKIAPIQFINGLTVNNSQSATFGCGGSAGRSQVQTSAALRAAFGTISAVRAKVFLGTNDGNVVCGYVGQLTSPTMITGNINALSVCNNTPNRWSDLVAQNQTIEFFGGPAVSQTVIYESWTACGGSFNSRILELYIR
jgi:hypothetical protein